MLLYGLISLPLLEQITDARCPDTYRQRIRNSLNLLLPIHYTRRETRLQGDAIGTIAYNTGLGNG